MRLRKDMSRIGIIWLFALLWIGNIPVAQAQEGKADNSADWFYPAWAAQAKFNQPIKVRDTDSALGRYSLQTKQIGLKDLARIHGHLCDGLVIAFVEIKTVLEKMFPNGVVDRTDLRAVSKNGPCIVDAVSFMTGARVNFQTLRVDQSIGEGFIIQRISTGETYRVNLKPGVMTEKQIELERNIRNQRGAGKSVSPESIDTVEQLANQLIRKVLNTPPQELLEIHPLPNFQFVANLTDFDGGRGDVINKNMPRKKTRNK